MNILADILSQKRIEIGERKRALPKQVLQRKELFSYRRLSLERSLRSPGPAIIGEVKKASPSKGVIRRDFDPLLIAREYIQNGAAALSVLTDEKFFQGDLRFIERMRTFVNLPILRKDFIIDSYQLYESKAHGADAVLLIVAALSRQALHDLLDEAHSIDLECLVEVHTASELEVLDFNKVRVVGINNRDLTTFTTDINVSATLCESIPTDVVVVSESGIRNSGDIRYLMSRGISSFLIGEAFMQSGSPGKALSEILASMNKAA